MKQMACVPPGGSRQLLAALSKGMKEFSIQLELVTVGFLVVWIAFGTNKIFLI